MIVLSVGMPRAGSGWHYNLVHDLMKTTGCAEAREIRVRLEHELDLVIDSGPCGIEPTTVVDLTADEPQIVRKGRGALDRLGIGDDASGGRAAAL